MNHFLDFAFNLMNNNPLIAVLFISILTMIIMHAIYAHPRKRLRLHVAAWIYSCIVYLAFFHTPGA